MVRCDLHRNGTIRTALFRQVKNVRQAHFV